MREEIIKQIEESNLTGLRVLSIASKLVHHKNHKTESEFIESNINSDYIYEGFVGIEDPIREEAFDAF